MAYLSDRSGNVFQLVAETDGFVWVRRLEDGVLDTLPSNYLTPYAPKPQVGEVWLDGSDEVVIVGLLANGTAAAVALPLEDEAEWVSLMFYTPEEITPKGKPARPRGGQAPVQVPPEPQP